MAVSRLCSIPNCGKPATVRGWCPAHYQRWRAHGDPNAGRPLQKRGEAMRYLSEVVMTYDGVECLTWPFRVNSGGYGVIDVDRQEEIVSRMVCQEVNGPPPTPHHEAAHSCGNGHLACVAKGHMRWATRSENSADRLIHGTHFCGERQNGAKLTEGDVRKIRALRGEGLLPREIGEMFGVSNYAVYDILKGRTWSWLE